MKLTDEQMKYRSKLVRDIDETFDALVERTYSATPEISTEVVKSLEFGVSAKHMIILQNYVLARYKAELEALAAEVEKLKNPRLVAADGSFLC